MAEETILKPRSFRIDDETAEKFKEISAKIGGNQQDALTRLIEAYEFQNGKAVLVNKKSDIEQFEKYINAISRMFMGSLEDNENLTATVQAQFDALLRSKDTVIQKLQEETAAAKKEMEKASQQAKSLSEENNKLTNRLYSEKRVLSSEIDNLKSMLQDKESLNAALSASCNELQDKLKAADEKLKEYPALKKENEGLQSVNAQLKSQLALEQERNERLREHSREHELTALKQLEEKHQFELSRQKEQAQIQLERALLEAERKYQEQIRKIQEEKQEEVDKYQQKYLAAMERFEKGN